MEDHEAFIALCNWMAEADANIKKLQASASELHAVVAAAIVALKKFEESPEAAQMS